MNQSAYLEYLSALNFKPEDMVCVSFGKGDAWVGDFFQPFSTLSTPTSIAKLAARNDAGQNIYISMAPFRAGTTSRKKEFVSGVRHVFADADAHGPEVLAMIKADVDAGTMPRPAIGIESSPNKIQVIWRVSDFDITKQEALNRAIQFRYNTDPATVDTARVLRVPGFINHKYESKPLARVIQVGDLTAHPSSAFKIETAKPEMKAPPTVAGDKIPRGQHDNELHRIAGRLRYDGLEEEAIYNALVEVVEKRCEDYGTDYLDMCRKHAHNICKKSVGKDERVIREPYIEVEAEDEVVEVGDAPQVLDMPESAIPDCSLGYVLHKYMETFPRAYAWPALLTVAGTMVPLPAPSANESIATSVGKGSQTNLFTALIGDIHSGKSQAIEYARYNLGLRKTCYTDVKAGSVEGLLAKLMKDGGGVFVPRQLMWDVDEWSHFFKKAGIDNAAFVDVLNTGFNRPEFHLTIAGGKEIDLTCALSIIGGIVTDKIQECFNSSSTGGFYDRFLFGVCPTQNPFVYFPVEDQPLAKDDSLVSLTELSPAKINRSVWELAAQWKKADPSLGRSVEVTVRCASIIASFDQRSEINAKDLEAMRPFLDYQQLCRSTVVPSSGITHDAKMSNAILGWLRRHTVDGQWAKQRDLKHGISRPLEELGPKVYTATLWSLGKMQAIETKVQPNSGTRESHLIRLAKGM
ncbi:MAG TPA: DNA-primase RepB domain-containing protein [Candidatus Dormibacteraeota bacterium]|nr:DNA-primase RepB domain-containing protein [Candidatus Dormibacteraeota bacterium]